MQPLTWSTAKLESGTDSTFASNFEESDEKTIAAAVQTVAAAIDKAKSDGRKVLLYLGVGVGNPSSAWGNPSVGVQLPMADQINPPFLLKMVGKGYFVAALNFNVASTEAPAGLPKGDGLHLHVPAKFPLERGRGAGTMKLLTDLRQKCDRVVVLNAVSQLHYQTLVELGISYSARKVLEESHVPSTYISSYGETNSQTSYAKFPGVQRYLAKPTNLADEDDVFVLMSGLDSYQ
jgi:hypothetical protein